MKKLTTVIALFFLLTFSGCLSMKAFHASSPDWYTSWVDGQMIKIKDDQGLIAMAKKGTAITEMKFQHISGIIFKPATIFPFETAADESKKPINIITIPLKDIHLYELPVND